jgi:hypothetical protein
MTRNVGMTERTIRIIVGVALLLVAFLTGLPAWGMILAGIIGAVALVTGAVGFCPAWKLLGLNTCAREPGSEGAMRKGA